MKNKNDFCVLIYVIILIINYNFILIIKIIFIFYIKPSPKMNFFIIVCHYIPQQNVKYKTRFMSDYDASILI